MGQCHCQFFHAFCLIVTSFIEISALHQSLNRLRPDSLSGSISAMHAPGPVKTQFFAMTQSMMSLKLILSHSFLVRKMWCCDFVSLTENRIWLAFSLVCLVSRSTFSLIFVLTLSIEIGGSILFFFDTQFQLSRVAFFFSLAISLHTFHGQCHFEQCDTFQCQQNKDK